MMGKNTSRRGGSQTDVTREISGLAADATTVITRRVGQMASGRMTGEEALRMVAEKQFAFADAVTRAQLGAMRGDFPATILADAMVPIRETAGANARRLTARQSLFERRWALLMRCRAALFGPRR